jgi:hypothetical protein
MQRHCNIRNRAMQRQSQATAQWRDETREGNNSADAVVMALPLLERLLNRAGVEEQHFAIFASCNDHVRRRAPAQAEERGALRHGRRGCARRFTLVPHAQLPLLPDTAQHVAILRAVLHVPYRRTMPCPHPIRRQRSSP